MALNRMCVRVSLEKKGGRYSYIHLHTLEIMEEVSHNVQLKESGDNSQVLRKRGEKASVHQSQGKNLSLCRVIQGTRVLRVFTVTILA